LAANLFPTKSAKEQKNRSLKKQKEKENHVFPEILKPLVSYEKTCKQEFQQNKPQTTTMA